MECLSCLTFSKRYRELSSFTEPAKILALGSTEMGSVEGCCEMPTKNGWLGKMQIHKNTCLQKYKKSCFSFGWRSTKRCRQMPTRSGRCGQGGTDVPPTCCALIGSAPDVGNKLRRPLVVGQVSQLVHLFKFIKGSFWFDGLFLFCT